MQTLTRLFLLTSACVLLAGCGDEGLNSELDLLSITADGTPYTHGGEPIPATAGELVGLRVNAVDPDGGSLTYLWNVNIGTLSQATDDTANWQLPDPLPAGDYTATVDVHDEQGDAITADLIIRVS
ncbi:MAG: hypothetical protein ABI743_06705 [bacterium]